MTPVNAPVRNSGLRTKWQVVQAAARSYGVDPNVLWGIYGAESSYGRAESSFGLTSDYPGTGTSGNFVKDAYRSAQILSNLLKQYGSYNTALEHYSGYGYGLSHIQLLESGGGDVKSTSPGTIPVGFWKDFKKGAEGLLPFGIPNPGNILPGGITGAAQSIEKFFSLLLDPHFYIRMGEALAGIILIYMGLKNLSGYDGVSVTVKNVADRAAEAAAVVK